MSDTVSIKNRLHKDRKEIISFVKKHENIYLYGTGAGAAKMKQYLDSEECKITGFLVSNGQEIGTSEVTKGYTVEMLSDAAIDKNKDGIIVTVGIKKREEIRKILVNAGYSENVYYQKIFFSLPWNEDEERAETDYMLNESKGGMYFSDFVRLDALGREFHTDKASDDHNYLNKYELFLDKLRDKKFTMIEMGVYHGASLMMWNSYFKNATVVGVDIDNDCLKYKGENREILILDLGKEESILQLRKLKPTLIVDDASHFWSHQITALFLLFEALPSGGIYIVEDLGTSFTVDEWYKDASMSAYDICSAIAEVATSKKPFRGDHLFKPEIEAIGMQTEMISFICGSCILIKK